MEFLVSLFTRNLTFILPALTGHWETDVISMPLGATIQGRATFNEQTVYQEQRFQWVNPIFGESISLSVRGLAYELRPTATANIYEIDYTWQTYTKTALSEATVVAFNEDKECELDNWQLGVPKNILGKKCTENDPGLNAGDKTYSLLKIDGQSLYFGKDEGTTPARRSRLFLRYEFKPVEANR